MSPSSWRFWSSRFLGRVLGLPCAPLDVGAVALAQKREFKHREDAGVLEPGHEPVGVQPVADEDGAAVLVDRGQHVAAKPAVGLVAVLLRAYPIQALQRRRQ